LLRKVALKQKAALLPLAGKAALVVEWRVDRPSWTEQETGVWLLGRIELPGSLFSMGHYITFPLVWQDV